MASTSISLSFASLGAAQRKRADPAVPAAARQSAHTAHCSASNSKAARGAFSRRSSPAHSSRRLPSSAPMTPLLAASPALRGGLGLRSLFFTAATLAAASAVFASAAFASNGNGAEPVGPRNVLGGELGICSTDPMTGFMRNGRCETGPTDFGTHTVCAKVTAEFLQYTLAQGNDLITPRPEYRFPGLKEGDGWCLCASRWREALAAGAAPPVVLEATHDKTLQYVDLATLQRHAAGGGTSTQ